MLSERDQVSVLRIGLVAREMTFVRARSANCAHLSSLRSQRASLEKALARQQARSAAALTNSLGGPTVGPPPGPVGSFASHGGTWGFFQAAGTNYSVGNEPAGRAPGPPRQGAAPASHRPVGLPLAAALRRGRRLRERPHTRGEASDTPGVEGVPEGTLRPFGLTRPFGGAAEADHIQLG